MADGGCIVLDGSAAAVTDGLFTNCSAGSNGGAIAVRGNSNLTIANSLIRSSSAGSTGGGISSTGALVLSISAVNLTSCTAGIGGGGIAVNNTQPSSMSTIGPYVAISNCSASASATSRGGGLYLYSAAVSFAPLVAIETCSASYGGGAALLGGSAFPSTLKDSTVIICNNRASIAGGGLFSDDPSLILPPSLAYLSDNSAATACNSASSYSDNVATPPNRIVDRTDSTTLTAIARGIAPYSTTPLTIFSLAVVDNFGGVVSVGTTFTCVASAAKHLNAAASVFLRNASTFTSMQGIVAVSGIGFEAPGG